MKHTLRIMTDDLDDCYMLYDYAKDAKEDNNQKDMIFSVSGQKCGCSSLRTM